jgi:hypothetical protein
MNETDQKGDSMTQTTLCVPDAHVLPGQDLSRFAHLGRLIEDHRPDNIVLLGDFITLEALSHWDLGKPLLMEDRRYCKDIEAGVQALALSLEPMFALQAKQRKNKERLYKPRLVYCIGNHEDRLSRYLEKHPQLVGQLDVAEDLGLREFDFTDVVPYRSYLEIEGVQFTHAVMHGSAQPYGGKYAVMRSLEASAKSVVFAHLHRKEAINLKRHGDNTLIQGLSCGAFLDEIPEYARGGLTPWWLGTILLQHTEYGRFDVAAEYSMERLRHEYPL